MIRFIFITIIITSVLGCNKTEPIEEIPEVTLEYNNSVYNTSNSGISSNIVNHIAEKGNQIWIATENGVSILENNNWTILNTAT
jgi:ligand-binding sensor domain-containing protein